MSRFLVDTHVWLWLQSAPERIAPDVRDALGDQTNELLLSAASGWEIAIKYRLGQLPLPALPESYVPDRVRRSGTVPLAIELAHVLRVAELPDHHRDPFDRLLVAQAQLLSLTLVTADEQLSLYDVEVLAAAS